ncbi:MAG: DedA family protein [Magnetococcales bacterium]|nr:DedA family protein [Magnetococcales bacterium]
MEQWEPLIREYGYIILFVVTFLEGETILLVAGFMAQQGILDLPLVILTAFAGTFFGDQLYFQIGYRWGKHILNRLSATWHARSERVNQLLHRYDTWFILGFRFVYGVRNVTPFALGSYGIRPLRFFLLNGLAALVWAMIFGVCGYVFGRTVDAFFDRVSYYAYDVLGGLFIVGIVVWAWRRFRRSDKAEQTP